LSGRPVEDQDSRCFTLSSFPFRVGRRSGLSLSLPRNTVSGRHAEFFEIDQKLFIRDLASTNGTFVNGNRLTGQGELHDGDVVQFADVPFRLSRSLSQGLFLGKPLPATHYLQSPACTDHESAAK